MRRILFAAIALSCALPLTGHAQTARAPVYQQPLSTQAVEDVQARLQQLGYYGGPVDGVWGGSTRDAIERFQNTRHLAASGELNQATVTAMGLDPDRLMARGYAARPAPPAATTAPATVDRATTRAVQAQLRRAGLYHGPVDGVWGRNTRLALEDFQRQHGEAVTGEPSHDTLVALGLRPQGAMSGSSVAPSDGAERLNHEELERGGQ
jgi:peptidoglycan hydrolase-like protein with peptidoglycan-binding domain